MSRLGPLAERNFTLLFFGRTVSLFGTALAPVALAFAVLDLTGSPSDLGLVLAAASVPQVVLLLAGGIWADRLPRHHVMVASDLASGGAQAAIAALLLTGTAEVWHLAALQVVRGAASAFFFPAVLGVVPDAVSRPRLQQANALLGLSRNATQIGGAAAGGILVAAFGPGWTLAFDAATYAGGAVFLALMRLPRATLPERRFLRELREGWEEFRSRTWLWAIVVEFAFLNATAAGAVFVLGPVVAERSLGGAAAWGAITASTAAGMLLAGVVGLRYKPERPLLVASAAILLVVPQYALLGAVAPLPAIAAASLVAGAGIEIFGVLWNTTIHEHVPRAKLSRVSSYDALGSFVFMPVGYAVAGPVAETVGVAETLWAAGALFVVATVAVLAVRDVRSLPYAPAGAPARASAAS